MKILFSLCLLLSMAMGNAQISGAQNICPGTIYTYTAGSGTLYSWSITGGTIQSGAGTKTLKVQWGNSGGHLYVTVKIDKFDEGTSSELMATPFAKGAISNNTGTICPNSAAILLLSGQNGAVNNWQSSINNGPWTDISNTAGLTQYTVTPGQTTAYRAVINAGACGIYYADAATVPVAIPPTPAMPAVTQQCGSALLVAPTPPAGYSYFWQNSPTGTSAVNSIQNYTVTTSGNYYLRAQDNTRGCWGATTGPVTLNISQPPAPAVTSVPAVCSGSTSTFTVTGSGSSYRWYYVSGGDFIREVTSSTFTTPALYDNTDFYVSAVANGCESAKTTATATVRKVPAPAISEYTQQCNTSTVSITAAPAGYIHYWQTTIDGTATSNSSLYLSVNTNSTVYLRTKETNTGCWSPVTSKDVQVITNPAAPPVAAIEYNCGNAVLKSGGSPDAVNYYWQTTASATAIDKPASIWTMPNGPVSLTPNTVTASGTYYIRARLGNIADCWSTVATAMVVRLKPCLGGQDINYVVSNVIQKEGITSEAQVDNLPIGDRLQTVTYADGFGRPVQTINTQASPAGTDIIQLAAYDAFGRESRKYLPYVNGSDGKFKYNTNNALLGFYDPNNTNSDHALTSTPWLETVFEASPLNRVKEQGAAGEDWQIGTGHTVKTDIRVNNENEVRTWNYNSITGNTATPGYYDKGALLVTTVTDADARTSSSYVDKEGRLVLSKAAVSANAGDTAAQTYYVYDDFGRLAMVVQPEGVRQLMASNWTINPADAAFINKWCFTYEYDKLGRVSTKKIPGASPQYIVYNQRDQVILTQDGNQRRNNRWSFIKYDALQRPVMTGSYNHGSALTQDQMQQAADTYATSHDGNADQYEARTATQPQGYTLTQSFPVLSAANSELQTIKYYDDYNFNNDPSNARALDYQPSGMTPEPIVDYQVNGLLTGTKVRVLGTDQMLLTVSFYDKYGRVIQTFQSNQLGGSDIVSNRLDFSGKVLETIRKHSINTGTPLIIRQLFSYDHTGRQTGLQHQINDQPMVTMAVTEYNDLGQSMKKKLHSTDNSHFLQNIDYRYNIRGWLTHINDANLSDTTDLFGMELRYNDRPLSKPARQGYYGGNIAEMIINNPVRVNDAWKRQQFAYVFTYDGLERLTDAEYTEKSASGWDQNRGVYDEKGIAYDLNGNIKTLKRYAPGNTQSPVLTHDFRYEYNGNQLTNAPDATQPASLKKAAVKTGGTAVNTKTPVSSAKGKASSAKPVKKK